MIIKTSIIKKLKDGKYRLYSRQKDQSGNRRDLGTYDSLEAAKEREKSVQYFKHHADDGLADDKQTKALGDLSNIAVYLEEAGFVDKAKEVYDVMDAMDGSLCEDSLRPDNQMNTENEGFIGGPSPVGNGYGGFGLDEAMRADDIEQDNVDLANFNGIIGNTAVSNNFQGLMGDTGFFKLPGGEGIDGNLG